MPNPRRTWFTNKIFVLPGGTEDNNLHAQILIDEDTQAPIIRSTWEFTPEERERIANGENIQLDVWAIKTHDGKGITTPPVLMRVSAEPLGKPPGVMEDEPS